MCYTSNIEDVYFFIVNIIKQYEAFELSVTVWCSIKTCYRGFDFYFFLNDCKKKKIHTILSFVAYKINKSKLFCRAQKKTKP